MAGRGRGGRGALLLEILKSQTRRPGEEGDTDKVSKASQPTFSSELSSVGRGRASLHQLLKSKINETGDAGFTEESAEVERQLLVSRTGGYKELPRQQSGRASNLFRPPSSCASVFSDTQSERSPGESLHSGTRSISEVPVLEMKKLSIKQDPPTKALGTSGKPINLGVNYLNLKIEPGRGVYEYHVSFQPDIDNKKFRFNLVNQQIPLIGNVRCFDGMKLYLPNRLAQEHTLTTSAHPVDQSNVQVAFKFIKVCAPRDCIHLYNVILKRIQSALQMTRIGRNYFSPQSGIPIPQHKLEVWPGYVTAVSPLDGGVKLNLDVSHRVLRSQTVYELMKEMTKTRPRTFKDDIFKLVTGSVVLTRYNNKTYRIDDIEWNETPQSTFTTYTGTEQSYIDYYWKSYQIKIMDLNQPLLIHRERSKGPEKKSSKLICLIPELSYLTGLTDEMRADFQLTKAISTHMKMTPTMRLHSYRKFIENVNNCPKALEQLTSWGLRLDTDIFKMDGRLLNPEKIIFKTSSLHSSAECDWGNKLGLNAVLLSVALYSWIIIYFQKDENFINEFIQMIKRVTPPMGMEINEPQKISLPNDRTESYLRAIRDSVNPRVQMVVTVCPTPRDDRYSAIKKLCCADMPIPSQVINTRTIRDSRKLRSVTQKICLQMNCKLGGELWAVDIPLNNLMVCGIDVYHNAAQRHRSVAAFLGSLNRTLTRWFSKSYFQAEGQELIDGLKVCFLQSLKKYLEVNHNLPDVIMIFRDGVGDGQLKVVSDYEVQQLATCFEYFGKNYHPQLCVVVVQCRINTRLFTLTRDPNELDNAPSGTIVDHTVARPDWFDFFLVSQHVRQGTVTPTHYIVVHNSSNLKADHIQRISYKLTHLYFNWPGTVKVPAPCLYAHKLASLIGQNVKKEADIKLSDKLFFL